ncbi:glycosyltransferase involved in cell wall biosynthesis [Spirosoma lacussanchae]|uniref:glycosyltransferase n=1 Tax=Spirosoma lacussanchae TaxID=1884249 RepID=UPI001BB27329|nr:glycosyltransferase [Spirosoma lacussanchae]
MNKPLVSIIIPCYNQGRYLQQAINSAARQTYTPFEIVVIDDGSTDETKAVALQNPWVRYVYQDNQGLSAARNTGIDHSQGDYLVFLDADDLLLPGALSYNVQQLFQHPTAAFVSGAHIGVDEQLTILWTTKRVVRANHYRNFLRINYIGMHATVMYRRWVFTSVRFDTSLSACEDYDLYLTISAVHPVHHHTEVIAAYRRHQTNMSSNILVMLSTVLSVLQRQEKTLRTAEDQQAYQDGVSNWRSLYGNQMYVQLINYHALLDDKIRIRYEQLLRQYQPNLFLRYRLLEKYMPLRPLLKRIASSYPLRWVYRTPFLKKYSPPVGSIHIGDLKRTSPISTSFGYDRGGPVDRYYIERFLQQQAASIQGRVLEIGDNEYTLRFGGSQVAESDVLHVHADAPQATLVGDLTHLPQVPDHTFDCIVLTQTLHLIYDFKSALQTCYRILKPGGVLLMTSPGISPIDHGEWKETWYWSFNELSLRKTLSEHFPINEVEVDAFGNVLVATAFLYGLGISELDQEQLNTSDPHYPVIITAKARKLS